MTGRFIVLEGVDASGKSTQARRLVDWLVGRGIDAIYTRHPGSTAIGAELRGLTAGRELDANTKALLFAADNSAFITQILRPRLEVGTWIVSDRNNFVSSLAYQVADGCPLEQLDRVHDATAFRPPKIDLLLILCAKPETIAARRCERALAVKDVYEERMATQKYFDKVASTYQAMAQGETFGRLPKFVYSRPVAIDADGDVETVSMAIKSAVKSHLLLSADCLGIL